MNAATAAARQCLKCDQYKPLIEFTWLDGAPCPFICRTCVSLSLTVAEVIELSAAFPALSATPEPVPVVEPEPEKRCIGCKVTKPLTDFDRHRHNADRRHNHCKACRSGRPVAVVAEPEKVCRRCKESKPLTDFHVNTAAPDGRQTKCKACRKAAVAAFTPVPPAEKVCSKCAESKPAEAFSRASATTDGLYPVCKECHSEQQKRKVRNDNVPGYLYVIEATNGVIKVGRTINGDKRIREHRNQMAQWGVEMSRYWVSPLMDNMLDAEYELIRHAANHSPEQLGNESFRGGIGFDELVRWVVDTQVSPKDVAA